MSGCLHCSQEWRQAANGHAEGWQLPLKRLQAREQNSALKQSTHLLHPSGANHTLVRLGRVRNVKHSQAQCSFPRCWGLHAQLHVVLSCAWSRATLNGSFCAACIQGPHQLFQLSPTYRFPGALLL